MSKSTEDGHAKDPTRTLSSLKRKRGVVKRSITRLLNNLKTLETTRDAASVVDQAKQAMTKLESLDKDYRSVHYEIVDQLEEGPDLDREHEVLDQHEDDVTDASLRLQRLIAAKPSAVDAGSERASSRKLARVESRIKATEEALALIKEDHDDVSLLEQYQEQMSDVKRELSAIYEEIVAVDLPDDHALVAQHAGLEKLHFRCSHMIKKLLNTHAARSPKAIATCPAGDKTSKLPKLDVPTFDGDVLHWQPFWEQFETSVHNRTSLSNAEKLVYLQQAIRSGSAKTAIEGLSHSGDQYGEAVSCLKGRYNRPRLIHRAHVRTIMDTPPLKDSSGKELRRLHDSLQQHLRALKTMKSEPDPSFVTSIIELKLDETTLFEWQKHSQEKVEEVPHYRDILEFIDLRAQAAESIAIPSKKQSVQSGKKPAHFGRVASYTATSDESGVRSHCLICVSERHPLYTCPKFKAMSHDEKRSTLRKNNLCLNCLGSGHFVKQCKSSHRCRKCQRPHHTLLHVETHGNAAPAPAQSTPTPPTTQIVSNTAVKLKSSSLLMTCRVLVFAPNGFSVEARALLDNGSTSSFVSERLVQSLGLSRSQSNVHVSGIAGSLASSPVRSIANFQISSAHSNGRKIDLTAIVLPKVTCDLPVAPVPFDLSWSHLAELPLADPAFGEPRRVDILLGVDVFVDILRNGRRTGPSGSPVAVETEFGWVICGGTCSTTLSSSANLHVASHHASAICSDDILRKFWEIEESPACSPALTVEERFVVQHFETNHARDKTGRFVVPLPRRPDAKPIGESRSQAVRRFYSLERSLRHKDKFREVDDVVQEYLTLGHAEAVPIKDADKDPSSVFYLPMHVVYKDSSSTTKVRAVFDASAKSTSGVSLNDTLLVGPTVHPPLIDVLLRFRIHRIALTADVSKMYRAIELVPSDRDFHRFVWRSEQSQTLKDYRMTRATFGVSASCFAANMAVKQNAIELASKYPLAADAVHKSFYVDDGLTGADDIDSAIALQQQLQDLFTHGGFMLRKWNSSEPRVLQAIYPELRETKEVHSISTSAQDYTKTLGLEWNTTSDTFHLTVSKLLPSEVVTKRILVSDIAKVFDVLGWFAPATVAMKILLQRVWEERVDWDDPVPEELQRIWHQWRSELPSLTCKSVPRCYFPKNVQTVSIQIHGFSDASEDAYAGVVYLRMVDSKGTVHTSLVVSKTKVCPIKRLSIPRLELCGAQVLARLLHHVKGIFQVPMTEVYAWTDSTIVLSWLSGSPRRFKTYVGNRVSEIIDRIPPDRWSHVVSADNPADCASRGVLPSRLLEHKLWWTGPPWLRMEPSQWPKLESIPVKLPVEEERETCLLSVSIPTEPVVPIERYSTFTRIQRVVAWVMRFVNNCRPSRKLAETSGKSTLTVTELVAAEKYLVRFAQETHFTSEITLLKARKGLPRGSSLLPLHPFIDADGVLRVGGRECNSKLDYSQIHPIILPGNLHLTRLLIRLEHVRLLHAGPTLVFSSLSRRFYILGMKKSVRSVIRHCTVCQRCSTKPTPQMLGQLPAERVTPGAVFEKVGVDYAGPLLVKYGTVRKPVILKAYICVFVSLSVKAVHLEAVSDLTSEAFIAALRRFVARRGTPTLIWSDNGTNFVGANRELKEIYEFLSQQEVSGSITDVCSGLGIEWRFIPEHSPHFGGLWEAAVKSTKTHLRRVVGDVKLTFEELSTILAQVEACLNSRPLVSVNVPDEDGIEVLTPGHFLIGRPLCALPDPSSSYRSVSLLKRWDLCQNLIRHFWQRWSSEYLTSLNKFNKWHHPTRNLQVGDVVIIREDTLVPTKWPLARVSQVHRGQDGLVRVVTVKTEKGTYKRPVTKLALLLSSSD